jgi:hypothetical protein
MRRGTTFELQPWITIRGTTATAGITPEFDDWLDTTNYNLAQLRVEAPFVTGCTLYLQGCDQSGGDFVTHASFGSGQTGASTVRLIRTAPPGATDRLNELLRWKVLSSGGNWEACFRITSVLK